MKTSLPVTAKMDRTNAIKGNLPAARREEIQDFMESLILAQDERWRRA